MSTLRVKNLEGTSVIARDERCVWRTVDDKVVILTTEDFTIHELDEVASRIWDLTEEPIRLDDVVKAIASEYDVGEKQVRRDTLDFISKLIDKGALRLA